MQARIHRDAEAEPLRDYETSREDAGPLRADVHAGHPHPSHRGRGPAQWVTRWQHNGRHMALSTSGGSRYGQRQAQPLQGG